ncbi:MAG: flagellar motor switch phosphatase FliY [Firmicutes bacterium]|nr:flagellar motor switch phosphatase FliY [Bacillota bacterium]
MDDKLLSQEEIDALLKAGAEDNHQYLDDLEIDALGEIGNIAMGSAATALSMLLGQEVKITTPTVTVTTEKELKEKYPYPYVLLEVSYVQGLEGTNLLVVQEKDALLISELMMGGGGMPDTTVQLDEMRLSAVGEAMNQMMGSSATAISTVFNKKIGISPPNIHYTSLADTDFTAVSKSEHLVQISFAMNIGTLADSQIMQILPLDFAKEMVKTLIGSMATTSGSPEDSGQSQEMVSAASAPPMPSVPSLNEKQFAAAPNQPSEQAATPISANKVVKPVAFAPLAAEQPSSPGTNLDLLLDIPLEVTVELGRTQRLIKDVLELGIGSVIELDKLAGEPVDVVVNGKLVARGEVVVIDENFGVRITDIITPVERVRQLQ